jgi:hypothetical protein
MARRHLSGLHPDEPLTSIQATALARLLMGADAIDRVTEEKCGRSQIRVGDSAR